MRRPSIILALAAVIALCLPMGAIAARVKTALPSRTIVGDFDTDQDPFINDGGSIGVAMYTEAGWGFAIIQPSGEQRVLQAPNNSYLSIHSFTNNGELLGATDSAQLKYDSSGNPTTLDLGTSGEDDSWFANAMNNVGCLVGEHSYYHSTYSDDFSDSIVDAWYTSAAYLWRPDGTKMQLQSVPGYGLNAPRDINDAGWVVGVAYDHRSFDAVPPTRYQAVLWSPDGRITSLRTGRRSTAIAISNLGEIAGYVDSDPVVWNTKGKLCRRLQKPTWATGCHIEDINDKGVVVGYAFSTGYYWQADRAVAWDRNGRLIELAPLPGDTGSWACHINNSNQIVGWSQQYTMFGFEPSSLVVWTVN